MNRSRPAFLAVVAAVVALPWLAGCASSGGAEPDGGPTTVAAGAPAAAATAQGEGLFDAWHDPRFYDPWFDAAAIVLPPPPFTGLSRDGKAPPTLPAQRRPDAGN